jgi:hypothetical protein
MGAFETFVNANLGIRKPLILDSGPPSDSDKAAGIIGSEYIDLDSNFLYEKTGENNSADWAFTRKLGDSLGEFSSDISSDFSSGISVISQDLVNLSGDLQNSLDIISSGASSGLAEGVSSLLQELSGLSGKLEDVSSSSFSSSVNVPSGVNELSFSYEDLGVGKVFQSKPKIAISLGSRLDSPPVGHYAFMTYGINTTGFSVSFSSKIQEDDLFLDLIINGNKLSTSSSVQWFEDDGSNNLSLRSSSFESKDPSIELWEEVPGNSYRLRESGAISESEFTQYFQEGSDGNIYPTDSPV